MVRRWKPQEDAAASAKAQSRWCARGCADPAAEPLRVYAPTPKEEAVLVALQLIAGKRWRLQIAGCKNAFRQWEDVRRAVRRSRLPTWGLSGAGGPILRTERRPQQVASDVDL
eukprot:7061162-Pyramimonas_sp.AAC.1